MQHYSQVFVKLTLHLAYSYSLAISSAFFFKQNFKLEYFLHNIKLKFTVRIFLSPFWISKRCDQN